LLPGIDDGLPGIPGLSDENVLKIIEQRVRFVIKIIHKVPIFIFINWSKDILVNRKL